MITTLERAARNGRITKIRAKHWPAGMHLVLTRNRHNRVDRRMTLVYPEGSTPTQMATSIAPTDVLGDMEPFRE